MNYRYALMEKEFEGTESEIYDKISAYELELLRGGKRLEWGNADAELLALIFRESERRNRESGGRSDLH